MSEMFEYIQRHWAIVVTIAGAVWTYFWLTMDIRYAKKEDFNRLQEAIKTNDKRVTTLEQIAKDSPKSTDISRLENLMTDIKGSLKATNATVDSMSHQVNLLVEDKILTAKKD